MLNSYVKSRTGIFSLVLLALLLCPNRQIAAQAGFEGPGRYQITNARTGGLLEVDRGDQTSIRQVSAVGPMQETQQWEIEPAATPGYFTIRAVSNGNALETVGPRMRPIVRATSFHGGPSQQWRFDPGREGATLIVSRSGRTMNTSVAANWSDQNRSGASYDGNQRFVFRRVSSEIGRRDRDRDITSGPRVVCSSDNDDRVYCNADTRQGVRLLREMSVSACEQGTTWGYDPRGIWVDQGCRAEFQVLAGGGGPRELIPAGTTMVVRTNETINVERREDRTYTGSVDQDVLDDAGRVAVPRGSPVELTVNVDPNNDLALDLDSVMVSGRRYAMVADTNGIAEGHQGIGGNRRTGEFVGGGAALGAIIGAIAGGGKGAAIGGLAGAAAGASAEIVTHGRNIRVPAESVLTFRLERPLRVREDRPNYR